MIRTEEAVLWTARILALGICVFLALLALDAGEGDRPTSGTVAKGVIHLLPSLALLAIVVLTWRRPWIAGVVLVGLAVVYAVIVRRFDWVLVISGPLLSAGLLFFWSWLGGSGLRRSA